MGWRYRRYFAVRLPSNTQYLYNKYMQLIKSVPTVKLHPTNMFHSVSHPAFPDEAESRGYHHIMVSVKGIEETKWLLVGLETMCRDKWTGTYTNYKEILPRGKK